GADAERQRVGGAIRMAAHGQPRAVDGAPADGLTESLLEKLNVRPELAKNEVPRQLAARVWCEDDEAEFVGQRERVARAKPRAASAMKHHDHRHRHARLVAARHVENTVADVIELEGILPGRQLVSRRGSADRGEGACGASGREEIAAGDFPAAGTLS